MQEAEREREKVEELRREAVSTVFCCTRTSLHDPCSRAMMAFSGGKATRRAESSRREGTGGSRARRGAAPGSRENAANAATTVGSDETAAADADNAEGESYQASLPRRS